MQLLVDENVFIPFFAEGPTVILERNAKKLGRSFAAPAWDIAYTDPDFCD